MEDKIEVGEYVRTKDGIIDEVIIEYNGKCNNPNCNMKHISCKYNYYDEKDIVKHSKDILELIKAEDIIFYYSNSSGIYIKCEVNYVCPKKDDYEDGEGYVSTVLDDLIRIEDIKSIVTKEQFKQVQYEV